MPSLRKSEGYLVEVKGENTVAPIHGHEIDRSARYANDTATWMAEMLYGSMRTNFDFTFNGGEIISEDGGSMDEVFDDAILEARLITAKTPNMLFELRRRLVERGELEDMKAMARGELYDENGEQVNTIVVLSDFPAELMDANEDVGGYNAKRKQAMLRVITSNNGTINVTTQSLDGSNREALEALSRSLGKEPEDGELLSQRINLKVEPEQQLGLVDKLTDNYDNSLSQQKGGSWHAGIRQPDKRAYTDTHKFAKEQQDLIEWFVGELKADPVKAEKLRFKLAATAKSRYESLVSGKPRPPIKLGEVSHAEFTTLHSIGNAHPTLAYELYREGYRAASRGESFSGCGVTVTEDGTAGTSFSSAVAKLLGYGNWGKADDGDECEFISKHCPECGDKDVVTKVTKRGNKKHIEGSCGCKVIKSSNSV